MRPSMPPIQSTTVPAIFTASGFLNGKMLRSLPRKIRKTPTAITTSSASLTTVPKSPIQAPRKSLSQKISMAYKTTSNTAIPYGFNFFLFISRLLFVKWACMPDTLFILSAETAHSLPGHLQPDSKFFINPLRCRLYRQEGISLAASRSATGTNLLQCSCRHKICLSPGFSA